MVGLLRHMASKVEGLAGVDKVRLVLDAPLLPCCRSSSMKLALKRSPWEISTSLRYGNSRHCFQ